MKTLTDEQPRSHVRSTGRYYEYDGDENTPADKYYSAEDAAKYLGLSKTWFYEAVKPTLKAYNLPTLKFKFYRKTDLDKIKRLRQGREEREES